jgi:uncharacterized membrane protein (DUF485 family)
VGSLTGVGQPGSEIDMPQSTDERRARARWTAVWLALIALGFYIGFILVTASK